MFLNDVYIFVPFFRKLCYYFYKSKYYLVIVMYREKGYHGTLNSRADKILKNGFCASNKDKEWLGFGVYFFTNIEEAEIWSCREAKKVKNQGEAAAVISCEIVCEEEAFFDLDEDDKFSKLNIEMKSLLKGLAGRNSTKLTKDQFRCAACNMFALKYKIKVYAFTFPLLHHNECGFPYVKEQRQICVRDLSSIKNIEKYFTKEVPDNAI